METSDPWQRDYLPYLAARSEREEIVGLVEEEASELASQGKAGSMGMTWRAIS